MGGAIVNKDIKNIPTVLSEQNKQLDSFLRQNQGAIDNISKLCSELQNRILSLNSDVDNTLKQLEMDMGNNHNILSKWVNGANTKLLQEQVSKNRISLLKRIKKLDEGLSQFSEELKKFSDAFNNTSSQLVINYRNIENQLHNTLSQPQTQTNISSNMTSLLDMLKQAKNALNDAKQGLEQRKVISEINNSIDKILH